MHDPTSDKFLKIQRLMSSGMMVGQDRPVGRVTYAKQGVRSTTSKKKGVETVRYMDKNPVEHELYGVRTIDIDRSIGQDAATCSVVMYNVAPSIIAPEGLDTDGTKGYLTFNRGDSIVSTKSVYNNFHDQWTDRVLTLPTDWLYDDNVFKDVLIPNTVLRTYQGYGSDNFDRFGNSLSNTDPSYVAPKNDTQLYLTGVWLIDNVTYTEDGMISIECRDLAKLLIEQYIYPPLIPVSRFPLIYCPAHAAQGHKESIGRDVATFHSSSVDRVYGYNHKIHGHRGSDAFDHRYGSYWLSGGNSGPNNVEWLQAKVHGPINEVYVNTWGKNYEVYVCVHENGEWQGKINEQQKVTINGSPTGGNFKLTFNGHQTANIPYNATATQVRTALVALSGVGSGDITVSGKKKGPWTVTFTGQYSGTNVSQMTATDTLTGGSSPNVTITTLRNGSTPTVSGNSENLAYADSPGAGNNGYALATKTSTGWVADTYTIVSGDTLWDLARHFYGDPTLWPIIARANNNIKDPHWIYPGQVIKIPYVKGTKLPPPTGGTGTGGTHVDIPYVKKAAVPHTGKVTIHLPRTYKAAFVRVVFKNLQKFKAPNGDVDYRAGVRTFTARSHILSTYHPSTIGKAGYIQDWTEPIKEMAAWSGLTWENATPNPADPVLGTSSTGNPLRVWGDFEILGAGPIVCTPGDYFMSKSFMDGIRSIVDFIGGIFYIDEGGGVQFRLPNIWSGGNFVDDTAALSSLSARFSEHPIEFHEDANLTKYSVVISDQSVRSEILVIGGYPGVNSGGPNNNGAPVAGGYVLGYNSATHLASAINFDDVLAGQYRLCVLPGDSTKLFYTEIECQRMAELMALFILFTYRQGTLTAPAHPGLQLDDQVRIFERTTYETNIHYVSSIKTHQDLESGEYTMDVTTHWLGKDPNTDWFVDKAELTPAVKQLPAIVKRIGIEAGANGDDFQQLPYGT